MSSHLESKFALIWRSLNGPKLEPEYRFDKVRKWRFDFAHPDTKIAIEIEGGVWNAGRHTRGLGFCRDCEKRNAATHAGWRVFNLPAPMLTVEHIQPILMLTISKT